MSTKPHASRRYDKESFESIFKRWKGAVEKEGTLQQLRNREYYEKPSVTRKRAKAAAIKRHQRKVEEEKAAREQRKRPQSKKKDKKEKNRREKN